MAKIIVRDGDGNLLTEFEGNSDESLAVQIQDQGLPIPVSCGMGACRSCCLQVKKGKEHIDPESIAPQQIEVEDDEVLSCICSLKKDLPDAAVVEVEALNL